VRGVAYDSMFHRLSTWWRALGVVLLGLATVTWPSASWAAPSPSLTIIHQDATATLSATGVATAGLALGTTAPRVSVAVYPALLDRTQLTVVERGDESGTPLAITAVSTTCAHHPLELVFVTTTGRASPACGRALLHLPCTGSSCGGVYPLRYSAMVGAHLVTRWSLVVVQAGPILTPLRVVLVASIGAGSWSHAQTTTDALTTLAAHANVPLALADHYDAMANALGDLSKGGAAWRKALRAALRSPLHQLFNAPPSGVDFGGLATNGFPDQVHQQLALGDSVAQTLTGLYNAGPVVLSGPSTTSDLAALRRAGVRQVVLDESSLTPVPSSTLVWGEPETIAAVPGLLVLSSDHQLGTLMSASGLSPEERAIFATATLGLLHFEAPNAPVVRTVILRLAMGTVSSAVENDLLSQLAHAQYVHLASLGPSFTAAAPGANGTPAQWSMVSPGVEHWSPLVRSALQSLLKQSHSFREGITTPAVSTALAVAVGATELRDHGTLRLTSINAVQSLLNTQLASIHIDNSSVTLTGQGTALPLTIVRTTHYPVTVLVHLVGSGLDFTHGATFATTLTAPTTAIRVALKHAYGSETNLQIFVSTPDGQLLIAHTSIQVRISGVSVVGYLLSALSLVVLALWWWRTFRRRSRGRRAA